MIQTRFRNATLALALLLGSASLWGQASRNRPTTRPETVGASILPNGGLEDPAATALPPMPSRPSDYPEECIPRTPDDVFYEDEDAKEGGIYEKILDYGDQHGIEYSNEQIERFKAFVDAYVAYLKALQAFEKARPTGWWLYPSQSTTSSNQFARTFSGAHSGKAAMRISGYFSVDHQIYTYPDPLPVRQKAKYLVSYWYRGNFPKSSEGANRTAAKLAVVKIKWIPKAGKALKLEGAELAPAGTPWVDARDPGNKYAKDGFFNQLIGMDLRGSEMNTWKEKYMIVEAPENAEKMTFELVFPHNESDIANYLLEFDDLSMTLIKGAEGEDQPSKPKPNVPTTPTRLPQPYLQRECSLSWPASELKNATYELELVQKRGKNVLSTKTLSTDKTTYLLEGLEPGYTYTVRLRALADGVYSEYSLPLTLETQALGEFPGGQIPFLYWIGEDGSCPLRLPLHYMELSNPQAKCLYYIDDVLTEPEGRILVFPSTGEHTLRVQIVEAPDRTWELEYLVTVK